MVVEVMGTVLYQTYAFAKAVTPANLAKRKHKLLSKESR